MFQKLYNYKIIKCEEGWACLMNHPFNLYLYIYNLFVSNIIEFVCYQYTFIVNIILNCYTVGNHFILVIVTSKLHWMITLGK